MTAPVNVHADVQAIRATQQKANEFVARFNAEAKDMGYYFAHQTEIKELERDLLKAVPVLLAEVARLQACVDAQAEALAAIHSRAERHIEMWYISRYIEAWHEVRDLAAPQPPASAAQAADGGVA